MVADLHSDLIGNALGRQLIEISAAPIFAKALSKDPPEVIVSPDRGSKVRAEKLARFFDPRYLPECICYQHLFNR